MMIRNKYIAIAAVILTTTPLIANNLVCPALTYNDVRSVKSDGDRITVNGNTFTLKGAKALPNWSNPITKIKWKPEVVSQENEGTAMLKCNYSYKTLIGRTYTFSIESFIEENVLIALAQMKLNPSMTYKAMGKAYKKEALRAHPDKDGSTEKMQDLNNNWDAIKAHFGMQ
tara:strand:- start:1233 stop:1745 length:513 start_codon:yes stop_codon:yes gene_type:complete